MNAIYFAQIREDSRVEFALSERFSPRRIAAIGSGGCTAFSLLCDDVDIIYAIDQNPAQAALIECKKAALAVLTREEYLAFLGETKGAERLETYARLRAELPPYARSFWDEHPGLIAQGLNHCGATERFYRFIGDNLRHNVYGDEVWQELLSCRTVEEQIAFSRRYLQSETWRTAVRILLSKTTHLQFFPAFMFAQAGEQDFGLFFESMFQRELQARPLAGNYFFTQLLYAAYAWEHPDGAPAYLTEEGYAAARRNLHKLAVLPVALQDAEPELQAIDSFYLSNVFDWATAPQRDAIARTLLQTKAPEAVLLYRNMLASPALPALLQDRFTLDESLSQEMTALERSMMYRQLTVGRLA